VIFLFFPLTFPVQRVQCLGRPSFVGRGPCGVPSPSRHGKEVLSPSSGLFSQMQRRRFTWAHTPWTRWLSASLVSFPCRLFAFSPPAVGQSRPRFPRSAGRALPFTLFPLLHPAPSPPHPFHLHIVDGPGNESPFFAVRCSRPTPIHSLVAWNRN